MAALKHRCHVPGCGTIVAPRMLMCAPHWGLVAPDTQARVYTTVKQRSKDSVDISWAPWWRAQSQAIAEVLEIQGHKALAAVLVARAEDFATKLEKRDGTVRQHQ